MKLFLRLYLLFLKGESLRLGIVMEEIYDLIVF